MALILCFHRIALQGAQFKSVRNQLSPRSLVQLLESAHTDLCRSIQCSSTSLAINAHNCRRSGERCGTHTYEDGHLEVGKQQRSYSRGNFAGNASEGGAHSLTRSDQDGSQSEEDAAFMSVALEEARQAARHDEVPIGAVLVYEGKIIARAHNEVEARRDPTAHAEMLVIQKAAAQQQGRYYLRDAKLYVTLEPCAMCAGAILVSRVGTVVYGAKNARLGADGSWTRLFPRSDNAHLNTLDNEEASQWPGSPHATHPDLQVRRGVLADECGSIVKQFFQRRRLEKSSKGVLDDQVTCDAHPSQQ